MTKRNFKKRLAATTVGVFLCALGISLCLQGNVGLDPFGAFNKGMGALLGLSLGNFQLLINCFIIAAVFYFNRSLIGPGTLINMVLVGYLIDLFSWLHSLLFNFSPGWLTSSIHLIAGLIIFTLGLSLHILADLGVGPYDAISVTIVERFPIPFRVCRIAQDVAFMSMAWLVKAPLGPATIIMAFFIGPLVTFWSRRLVAPLLGLPSEAVR